MTLSTGPLTVQCNHNLFQKASRANAGDKIFYDAAYLQACARGEKERGQNETGIRLYTKGVLK